MTQTQVDLSLPRAGVVEEVLDDHQSMVPTLSGFPERLEQCPSGAATESVEALTSSGVAQRLQCPLGDVPRLRVNLIRPWLDPVVTSLAGGLPPEGRHQQEVVRQLARRA